MPIVEKVIKVGSGELLIKAKGRGRKVGGKIGEVAVHVHAKPTKVEIKAGDEVTWSATHITLTPRGGKAVRLERHNPGDKEKVIPKAQPHRN